MNACDGGDVGLRGVYTSPYPPSISKLLSVLSHSLDVLASSLDSLPSSNHDVKGRRRRLALEATSLMSSVDAHMRKVLDSKARERQAKERREVR